MGWVAQNRPTGKSLYSPLGLPEADFLHYSPPSTIMSSVNIASIYTSFLTIYLQDIFFYLALFLSLNTTPKVDPPSYATLIRNRDGSVRAAHSASPEFT